MPFELKEIVPWGRSFDEYRRMFKLTSEDLAKSILGCGDGPASFNAEATEQGISVISVDPIYSCSREVIERRFDEVKSEVLKKTEADKDRFVWKYFRDVEHLGEERTKAMLRFLEDYEKGLLVSRYILGELPSLPFESQSKDIALVSHLLFLYSDHLDLDFHIASIRELLRIANEVRIFPTLQLGCTPSPHVSRVIDEFQNSCSVELIKVDYEFQLNGNTMLQIKEK